MFPDLHLELTSVFASEASFCSSQRAVQLGNTAAATRTGKGGAVRTRRRKQQEKARRRKTKENKRKNIAKGIE
jgi:hypothetical protein